MISPLRVLQSVYDELLSDAAIQACNIQVAVRDLDVILTGSVHSASEKLAAARAAERVEGVGTVTNDITVGLESSGGAIAESSCEWHLSLVS
jgi:osmotically-inducible protein OsmY